MRGDVSEYKVGEEIVVFITAIKSREGKIDLAPAYVSKLTSMEEDISSNAIDINYLKTIESAELNSPLFAQLREKWEKQYDSHNVQVDTLLAHWRNYIHTNTPDSLLALDFEGAEIERIRNLKKQIDTLVKAKIKIKPLRFPVDSFNVVYCFEPYSDSSCINNIKYARRIKDSSIIKVFPALVPQMQSPR